MKFLIAFGLYFISLSCGAAPVLKVIGLFKDKALVTVAGEHKLMRKGETYRDFTLKYSDSERAVISYKGRSNQYFLGMAVGGLDTKKSKYSALRINASHEGMYYTEGMINGQLTNFMVDTGATMITLNSMHARRLGIVPQIEGEPIQLMTASTAVDAFHVKLKTVKVGEIELEDIDAAILMGEHPDTALLGMSFLKKLSVNHSGNVMTLEKK